MKKVRYISNYYKQYGLTVNKVYDVVKVHKSIIAIITIITIINDHGKELAYDIYDLNYDKLFEDVTIEYRNNVIDEILL